MEFLIYISRCTVVLLFTWVCTRLIGKKSISQMTAYDLAATFIMANMAAGPLSFRVASKAFLGTLVIAVLSIIIGRISLSRWFYNLDAKPDIVIANGKVKREELKRNNMNLPFFLSLLREKGYVNVSDVEFAIIEADGNLSVIPRSQNRPVMPKDLKLETKYEGLALPLVIDGEIQYNNLKYAKLDVKWLAQEMKKAGASGPEEVFLAELSTEGDLYVDLYKDSQEDQRPDMV